MIDTHCKIGKVRLKGSRKITTRLPRKFLETTAALVSRLTPEEAQFARMRGMGGGR